MKQGRLLKQAPSIMRNRPRNRQTRPPRNNVSTDNTYNRNQQSSPLNHVPTTWRVVPGARVSIVLKADQPTGREVQGVVQDLLTRGEHPRGIKVRLQDGRIGRVQRIVTGDASSETAATVKPIPSPNEIHPERQPDDGHTSSLGDFVVVRGQRRIPSAQQASPNPSDLIKCPICGMFEGDEPAVSYHVQQHLDEKVISAE